MEDIMTRITEEEQKRIRKYADIIIGCQGRFDILTQEEQKDLQILLEKTMMIQATRIEAD